MHEDIDCSENGDAGSRLTSGDAIATLKAEAVRFGPVKSVSALPCVNLDDAQATYLVRFEHAADAIKAASEMKCYLFGYRTLVVTISRTRA